jgi:hypothetical protein
MNPKVLKDSRNFVIGEILASSSGSKLFATKATIFCAMVFWTQPQFFQYRDYVTCGIYRSEAISRGVLTAMASTRVRSGAITLFATAFFVGGPLLAQAPAATDDVRSEVSKFQDIELRLVRFRINGKEVVIPSTVTITLTFQKGGQISGRSAVPATPIFAARAVCSADKCADQFHVAWRSRRGRRRIPRRRWKFSQRSRFLRRRVLLVRKYPDTLERLDRVAAG